MSSVSFIAKSFRFKPHRTILLLLGFAVGVMVMTVLLSVGSAILEQAADVDLTGGGDVVLLPAGIDVSVLKTGGLTAKYFDIPNARYLTRELVTPRRIDGIRAVSPEIADVTGYLSTGDDWELVELTGVVPSRHSAVGFELPDGFADASAERDYVDPPLETLLAEIDHFHAPSRSAGELWAEWHYFNFHDPDSGVAAYLSMSAVAGDSVYAGNGYTRGTILFELVDDDRRHRVVEAIDAREVEVSLDRPTLRIGANTVEVREGRYIATAAVTDSLGRVTRVTLEVEPTPHQYIAPLTPPGDTDPFGYVVPVLRGDATLRVETDGRVVEATGIGYHDHNWGEFRRAVWNWGVVHAGDYAVLYGRFARSLTVLDGEPLLVAVFGPDGPLSFDLTNDYSAAWPEDPSRGPESVEIVVSTQARDFTLSLRARSAVATETGGGGLFEAAGTGRTFFFQLDGDARLSGDIGGAVDASGHVYFETFYHLP